MDEDAINASITSLQDLTKAINWHDLALNLHWPCPPTNCDHVIISVLINVIIIVIITTTTTTISCYGMACPNPNLAQTPTVALILYGYGNSRLSDSL